MLVTKHSLNISNLDTSNYIPVIFAADDKYAMPLAVTACSIFANLDSNTKLRIFIIDGGITEVNKQKIANSLDPQRCDIRWLSLPKKLPQGMKISGHISTAAYYRLLIPELLPDNYEKIIYLDCDLLLNRDIKQLWDIDIADNYILAVQEIRFPCINSGLVNYKQLNIPGDWKYFNSGVLVINLKKWRSENITQKAIQYLEQHQEDIRFHDQDALNAILAGNWGELDPRWNQTPFIYEYKSWRESPFTEESFKNILNEPWIIHFASSFKPWNFYQHIHKRLFYRYLDMTAWKGWRYTFWMALYKKMMRILLKNDKR
ncbi:glycosyltransferase family 8 protein [Calothrix sp. 336/3]|uniref:glycosyltransferase family 8 protein n=1 Tax=Calothrix sp. 336/3 TaxID=1337936 RepID=UPI0006248560|nr:glycosyltransferase family 8 protein [Calothrix sp. 336/3]AKG20952.1 hypothetical protein IJ00_06250 [Calothrix sp. 336/3]